MDILLRHLWDTALSTLSPAAQKEFPPLALVAIGGYGRGELNPHSDIDFMFLHDGRLIAVNRPLPHLARIIDGILYPLWDLGLKIGHSVRSLEECVKEANDDMQSKTSLIEARLIAGDKTVFKKFRKLLVTKCVDGHDDEYIAQRLADQSQRHTKFGNSACMQEPNLKNGCGGLRDFQSLLWMAYFKYRTRSLADLEARELVTAPERKHLEAAYDFLMRVRNELHYHLDRPTDSLLKAVQPAIASNLGYTDRSPSRRIEKFMRALYMHLRSIYLISRTLEQRLALTPTPTPPSRLSLKHWINKSRVQPRPEIIEVDGFKISDGEIRAGSTRVFKDQPRRLMRVFLHAQQRGLRLHPDLAQMIRNQGRLVDHDFLRDEHVRETFLTILNQRGNVAGVLRTMHEVDFLGKYIPEFGKLTCLVQHEFYHQYAADEHTLVCLGKLDAIATADQPPFNNYTDIFQGLEKPFVLYLALLLHDVGKADGHGKHAEVGSKLAARVAKRLGLEPGVTANLCHLIEHHLLMARVAQRHDLEDSAIIRGFARQVETPELLTQLTLLTFADSQGTSDQLWNGFKETLHWQLYRKAMSMLAGGTEFLQAGEKHREQLARDVGALLPKTLWEEELPAHFNGMPPAYFRIRAAREIAEDILLAHRFMSQLLEAGGDERLALAPVINWHNDSDRACHLVKVCTWDRPGLFSNLTGSFAAVGLNILSARIFTRADTIAFDAFYVTDAATGALASRETRDRLEDTIDRTLKGEDLDLQSLIARLKPTRPIYQAHENEHIETSLHFDNEISENRTALEIETEDRVGLLHVIALTLAELSVDISAAKIFTEKGAALDTFYIREMDGAKILDSSRQKDIERAVRAAIKSLDRA